MGKRLLLRSDLNTANNGYDIVLNWNSCKAGDNVYSIPLAIEDNSDQFKKWYLDWVCQLGQTNIKGKSVIDQLLIREDFSLWWMSLTVEKSKWKSPQLYQVFQLLALESILKDIDNIDIIDIAVNDANVFKSVKGWCSKHSISCKKITTQNSVTSPISFKKIFQTLPHILKAIVWLIYYSISRWPKKNLNIESRFSSEKDELCIISYFFNLDEESINHGTFYTRYWTKLHPLLAKNKKKINWVHLFVRSDYCPTLSKAELLTNNLNSNPNNTESHLLVDQNLCFRVVVKTLKDYFKIIYASTNLNTVKKYFNVQDSNMNFWHIISNDWKCSLFGKTAISNCLYLNIFEEIFKGIPQQHQGLYLLENQPWERAMLYAWKKNNHGQVIGVPHTTVSYWDLRHFYSASEYSENSCSKMPLPDIVALNGDSAIKAYRDFGFPEDRVRKVEALRYLYLEDVQKVDKNNKSKGLKLLVLGDCDPTITRQQLVLLKDCLSLIDLDIEILVKPHPLSPIQKSDYPELDFEMTLLPLDKLTSKYNVAFTSNPTAASVDVYLSQKKVLIMHDCGLFNMSPLRGFDGVEFIKTAKEMAAHLSIFDGESGKLSDQNFFYIDNKLPKWKALLST
jgi:surface carbohydrate biosynthesis protein (TIGR04326 family)